MSRQGTCRFMFVFAAVCQTCGAAERNCWQTCGAADVCFSLQFQVLVELPSATAGRLLAQCGKGHIRSHQHSPTLAAVQSTLLQPTIYSGKHDRSTQLQSHNLAPHHSRQFAFTAPAKPTATRTSPQFPMTAKAAAVATLGSPSCQATYHGPECKLACTGATKYA